MKTNDKLFADFAPVSKEQWKAKIIEDLKGADFDKKLVWRTDDGFSVQPIYTVEDREALNGATSTALPAQREWINYVEIKVDDEASANARAVKMMNLGATGFLFKTGKATTLDFDTLLNNLEPRKSEISFSFETLSLSLINAYFDYLKKTGTIARNVKGFVEYDVLENFCLKGTLPDFASLAELIKLARKYPHFKCLTLRSHAFVNAGASTTQELAFTLNKLTDAIEALTAAGVSIEDITDNLVLHMAIGGDYFFEIAKLRSLRVLLQHILQAYKADASKVTIMSSNATWSKSFYDPNVNMLRNTSEAMSALLGGCNALLSLPHDANYQAPSDFSMRVALNIANILKEESYFDKVTDPAAGSYYIENLTASITEYSLSLFKGTEAKGGFIKAFKEGVIQQAIAAVRDKKEKDLASRRRVYVGTNKYPNGQEKAVLKEKAGATPAGKNNIPLLVEQRATQTFEALRSRTLAHLEKTGFVPRVYLSCFGNLAMRKARATFSGEFFGTAGFAIMGEFFFNDAKQAAAESAKSEADIVVICSSDADYETSAVEFAQTFKSQAKNKTLVLAGYPEPLIDALTKAGVDTFIHVKSNVVEVLASFQNKLLS